MTFAMNVVAGSQRISSERPSLEGTLGDLKPMELLRLLSSTRQTGTLQVLADGPVLVTMVDGAVSYATCDPKLTLHDVLRGEGLVDEATWDRANAEAASPAIGASPSTAERALGDVLVDLGVDGDQLSRVVRRAVLDTMVDLAMAEAGRFRFATGRRHTIGARFLYPVDELSNDVDARLALWADVRSVIPAFTAVPRLTPLLTDRSAVTISAPDWRTLASIDGRRTLDEIRGALGTTRFVLGCSVANLVQIGAVEFLGGSR